MKKPSEFYKILLASFISQSGSHFLTLALSAFVLVNSGSAVQSTLVFVVSFLPSIFVSSRLGQWIDDTISKKLIIRNELIAALSSVVCGFIIAYQLPIALLCIVLAFRSILMFVTRAALTKWLKVVTPPEKQTSQIKIFYLSFFLSTALSGTLAGLVLAHYSIWTVIGLDVMSFVLGSVIIATLTRLPEVHVFEQPEVKVKAARHSLMSTIGSIYSMPAVRISFLAVCISQAIFQGAYSALVSYLPIEHFKIGLGGVGKFQLAASVGITLAFVLNWIFSKAFNESNPQLPWKSVILSVIASLALAATTLPSEVVLSLVFFFILNLSYECIWLHHNSEFFRASPKADAARYQFTLSATASFLMALFTLAYAAAIQILGTEKGTISVLGLGIGLALLAIFIKRPQSVE